jgi:hypothetical protein
VAKTFGTIEQGADNHGVGNGAAAAHRVGEVWVRGNPVVDGAAGDAEEIAQRLVGGAEQAIVMGEFDVFGLVARRLSGGPSVDPLRVSVDRDTPQHCSVLSRGKCRRRAE